MDKEFIPYELALGLKELGFDEECFSYYNHKEEITYSSCFNKAPILLSGKKCAIPTFSQAFRWFREKHRLIVYIQYYAEWNFEIFRIGELAEPIDDVNVDYTFKGGTYEEAELESLKELIKIVKNNG